MSLRPELVELDRHGDRTVAHFPGCDRLNEDNIASVLQHLTPLAENLDRHQLILDLKPVQYVTSTALGELVGLHRRLRAKGGQLVLVNLCPMVEEIFTLTRLHTILETRPRPLPDGATESLSA
jgi:anti-sigma B factor antagonist